MAWRYRFSPLDGDFVWMRATVSGTPPVDAGCSLLLQTGDALLLQNGDNLILQGCPEEELFYLLLQDGSYLLQQNGDRLVI